MNQTQDRLHDEKTALRQKIKGLQAAEFSGGVSADKDRAILDNLFAVPEFIIAASVFTYVSMAYEPDTREIIRRSFRMGKTIAVPLCRPGGIMTAKRINSIEELTKTGAFGILEPDETCETLMPEDIGIIIVPGIAFSQDFYRLGQGGGYYDRFLAGYNGFSAGLCRENFLLPDIPFESHDRQVSAVITERQVLRRENPHVFRRE